MRAEGTSPQKASKPEKYQQAQESSVSPRNTSKRSEINFAVISIPHSAVQIYRPRFTGFENGRNPGSEARKRVSPEHLCRRSRRKRSQNLVPPGLDSPNQPHPTHRADVPGAHGLLEPTPRPSETLRVLSKSRLLAQFRQVHARFARRKNQSQ